MLLISDMQLLLEFECQEYLYVVRGTAFTSSSHMRVTYRGQRDVEYYDCISCHDQPQSQWSSGEKDHVEHDSRGGVAF